MIIYIQAKERLIMKYALIKKLREKKGLSQIDLVKKLNNLDCQINQPIISAWENGKSNPNEKEVSTLCKIFECKEDDLISIGSMSMSEFKNDAFSFGSNFESNWLKDMYAKLTQYCDTEDKIRILTEKVIELSSMNGVAIPQSFVEVIRPSDDNESAVYAFIISFWNGSVLRDKPKDKIDEKYL